ncbi:DNA-directed RNA polymerase I subunit RPA34 [Streptomyces xanthochromogenes]|uniref:DNA-directed RNA polymerase I subunit RPA34 n=1 Tax=Streptomyces xanthochromogenes TaxID=67384 RepID=UPI0034164033
MRATRRTVRTAAIATGAIAALALPAGAAFADSPATPSDAQVQPHGQAGDETPKSDVLPGTDKGDEAKKDEAKKDESKKGDESKKDEAKKDEAKKDDAGKGDKKDDTQKDVRAFVKSVKLADGSVAKVYKLGQNHYEAEIWANGSKLDTLVAKGASATGQNNGLHVVLNPDGTVTSWVDGGKKKDEKKDDKRDERRKDERRKDDKKSDVISAVKITMPDGRIAKLIKTTNGPRVEISMANGTFLGAIDLKDPSALNDGWTYKIVNAGKGFYKFVVIDGRNGGNSWVYDFGGKLIEKYTVQKDGKKAQPHRDTKTADRTTANVVPKGGVKAGAEGVSNGSSDQTPMLAAGGGLAAAGAAGLGFAMLRRRGSQG